MWGKKDLSECMFFTFSFEQALNSFAAQGISLLGLRVGWYDLFVVWCVLRAQEVLGFPTPASVLDKTYALELQKCNFLSIFSPSHCGWWTLPWRWSCMGSFCASLLMEKALDFVWWRIPGSRDFLPFATSKRCLLLPFPSRNPMKGC